MSYLFFCFMYRHSWTILYMVCCALSILVPSCNVTHNNMLSPQSHLPIPSSNIKGVWHEIFDKFIPPISVYCNPRLTKYGKIFSPSLFLINRRDRWQCDKPLHSNIVTNFRKNSKLPLGKLVCEKNQKLKISCQIPLSQLITNTAILKMLISS